MKEIELKTYDIASYDIELEYNNQTAPFLRDIQKLNKAHESKSLKAHKDFLIKEKKSKDAINQLGEKSVVKNQRIERAVENKLKKLQSKENRYSRDLEEFIEEKKEAASVEIEAINQAIKELEQEENQNIEEIKEKYKTNIESYVEKLNIYNQNFEKNKERHYKQINIYQEQINQHLADVKAFYSDIASQLEEKVQEFLNNKQVYDNEIEARYTDASRVLSNIATNIRKEANVEINKIDDYVDKLKTEYSEHYQPKIDHIEEQINTLKSNFELRTELIQKDLEINITKLEQQLEDLGETKNKKARKNIMTKLDLFNMRASTTMKYEERLLHEQLSLLKKEQKLVEHELEFELFNLDKLHVFLTNDQNSLKNTGDHFKDLNLVLRQELNTYERTNNEYLFKHEQLKSDFIKEYSRIFTDLKQSTVELAQTYLEKIADNNHQIDEINKFLDTAEPLKEIEVNKLRENIEINEVQERFKIKYAKQEYEINIINNNLAFEIAIQEIKTKELMSEYNKEVGDIKNKEVFDKAIEKAKLKHSKAQEVYKLRLNNTKLERKLLESKYKTEMSIYDIKKELAMIDVQKHNALRSKEIEYGVKNLETEANYKIEVIQKALEEDLLKLEEQASKYKYEKDAFSSNLNREIDQKTTDINKQKLVISDAARQKSLLIDEALNRELREPTKNKIRTEAIIDERLSKLDVNNAIFVDFIEDSMKRFKDPKLSLEQIRQIIMSNEVIFDKSTKYVNRSYAVLTEAITFMKDIEIQGFKHRISATSDQGAIRKNERQIEKLTNEQQQAIDRVHTSENDHKLLIHNFITEEINVIKRSNPETVDQLIDITETSYNKVFSQLSALQDNLKSEIKSLYDPLTKHDQELIDYAEKNATKAKQIVEDDMKKEFVPLEKELAEFTKAKEQVRDDYYEQIDGQISELRAEINHLKNEALERIQEINEEKNNFVNQRQSQKHQIEETEEKEIVVEYERIDADKTRLTEIYNEAMQRLQAKDDEAKKIFDYEDRIYNIAVESATSRFNDGNVKSENVHLNNVKLYQSLSEETRQNKDKQEHEFNQALMDLTKSFEKNIFSVRPRLEESIGDAQKEIDNQLEEKTVQLQDLLDNNQNIVLSAENSLYTAFQEGYDKLSENLQNYIEKYRVIEHDYYDRNNASNDVISANNRRFNNALFKIGKEKHEATLRELLEINERMFREGE